MVISMDIDKKCEDSHLQEVQGENIRQLSTTNFQEREKSNIDIINENKTDDEIAKANYGLDNVICNSQSSEKDVNNQNNKSLASRTKHKQSKSIGSGNTLLKSNQLKDLLVLQLDLIEHQQIKILNRDKQIITLQNEKEQLEARLSRMERRISVQKRHSLELSVASNDDILISKQKALLIPLKSPAVNTQTSLNKKMGSISEITTIIDKNLIPVTVTSCNDKDFWFENFLRTNINYLDPPFSKTLKLVEICKPSKPEEKIPVPPWTLISELNEPKIMDVEEDGVYEEDISNNAYAKRHSKPEQEEKRRKRWDLQQARQQRQHEMLVQKYNEREQKSKAQPLQGLPKDASSIVSCSQTPLVESIYKESDQIVAVEISELVPVCAFGYPVPSLPPRELDLPWFSIAKREVQLRAARNKQITKTRKKSKGPYAVGRRKKR